jgi:hypothetical protein
MLKDYETWSHLNSFSNDTWKKSFMLRHQTALSQLSNYSRNSYWPFYQVSGQEMLEQVYAAQYSVHQDIVATKACSQGSERFPLMFVDGKFVLSDSHHSLAQLLSAHPNQPVIVQILNYSAPSIQPRVPLGQLAIVSEFEPFFQPISERNVIRYLDGSLPSSTLGGTAAAQPGVKAIEPPKRCVGGRGIKSLLWAPLIMAAGSSAAQAAGVSPDMVDDLASVPLAPQDFLFAAPSFVWEIYSENHRLPGSKAYEMHLLAEAYKHAPEAFGKCTGISAAGYSDPTFVPPPLPSHIMQLLANPVTPMVSSPSRGALMGCR